MKSLDLVALVLVLVGALNWALVAFLKLNVVTTIFGETSVLTTVVYGLVGLSALYVAYTSFAKK